MKKLIIIILLLIIPYDIYAYDPSATSAILMDTDNQRVIYGKDVHKVRSIASISKIMTAIIAIESNKLEDNVLIGDEINSSYGSGIYITKGEIISLEDLIYGLMLRSGNDAALAIANYVGGSVDNFVKMMNDKAIKLGMKHTTFNNPSGLDEIEGNYSTVYDMALLTSYCMQNEIYKKIVKTKVYTVKTNKNFYKWHNKNKLLKTYKYTTGGKTGYTKKAKRTLVTTASKNNVNLVAITFNDSNDFLDHQSLYEEAFKEYKKYKILKKGYIEIIDENYYINNKFYIKEPFSYILSDSEKDSIVVHFKLEKKTTYENNDKVGEVKVYLGDKEIFKTSIYIKIKKNKTKLLYKILGWFK